MHLSNRKVILYMTNNKPLKRLKIYPLKWKKHLKVCFLVNSMVEKGEMRLLPAYSFIFYFYWQLLVTSYKASLYVVLLMFSCSMAEHICSLFCNCMIINYLKHDWKQKKKLIILEGLCHNSSVKILVEEL